MEASELFGCEAFLSEERYREELARLRILDHDLEAVVDEDLGPRAGERPGRRTSRAALRLVMLRHPIHAERGPALQWLLAETNALSRFRDDTPERSRRRLLYWASTKRRGLHGRHAERVALESLWRSCVDGTRRARPAPAPERATERVRLRDLLLAATGEDIDHLVHPMLIRVCGAFLDQGVAFRAMPQRHRGLYACFTSLYGTDDTPFASWTSGLSETLRNETAGGRSAVESALDSLRVLGVPETGPERERIVTATLIALRGWAGMIHQLETRPDRVPVHAPPAKLVDFLAVRLLLERFALADAAARALGYRGALSGLRTAIEGRAPRTTTASVEERAYVLFQVSQILGRTPDEVARLGNDEISQVLEELHSFSDLERRRVFHRAYERRHRAEVLDAIAAAANEAAQGERKRKRGDRPSFQAVFCIDEREESFRRHIEEIDRGAETFGTAGYFGVAMYYRAVDAPHAAALCPVGIRPDHEVHETIERGEAETERKEAEPHRLLQRLAHRIRPATRTLTGGTLLTVSVGVLSAIPLVIRVLLPRLASWLTAAPSRWMSPPRASRLAIERDDQRTPSSGTWSGFTIDEMASIVRGVLGDTGLGRNLASIVLVIGHGSSSLNNPHESAHDCGACGGGRGGPNARAFAQMANRTDVRARLREQGVAVPDATLFVAVYHDTCDDALTFYEPEPEETTEPQRTSLASLAHARSVLERARAANAHERCRRFDAAPSWLGPKLALAHVEARARDLAQVRPEYGHATNAVCFIGRRSRTRGLFLDRRAFLVSYDPEGDDAEGAALGRTLAGAIPVCAGINLEYYFSNVDPVGYGCGTKLPHNITGLVGIMDGFESDLRTGLPWQMVEIHEPVRLLVIVEAAYALVASVIRTHAAVERLVRNEWIQLAALSPRGGDVHVLTSRGFVRYEPESAEIPFVASSDAWYGGQSDHLRPAIVPMSADGSGQVR